MNVSLTAALNFMMNGFKKPATKQEPSNEFKSKVKELNGMGLFTALKTVKNK